MEDSKKKDERIKVLEEEKKDYKKLIEFKDHLWQNKDFRDKYFEDFKNKRINKLNYLKRFPSKIYSTLLV